MKLYQFKIAIPVWEKGKECEKHYNLIFHCTVPKREKTILCLAASNLYQLFINGEMIAQGPARAGHGYYRVDEIDISQKLTQEENKVTIFVNGYYVKNYYLIKQKPFLCAEILADGEVTHATGAGGFSAVYNSLRIRKTAKYSRQRTFTEAYNCGDEENKLFYGEDTKSLEVELVRTEAKKFIERQVPYPAYDYESFASGIKKGNIKPKENFSSIKNDITEIEFEEKGFYYRELEINNADEIERYSYEEGSAERFMSENNKISPRSYNIYEMRGERTGFIKLEIECSGNTTLAASFDETLKEGDVSAVGVSTINSVVWNLKKGKYTLVTAEPYSLKYLKLINTSKNATVIVKKAGVIKYEFNCNVEKLGSGDSVLDSIYDAAAETFKQNTLDIYMDCPSRERAGWLCDSFFTARTEYYLTGKSLVEKNFLENFIYTDGFVGIPDGMLPMCYPADFRGIYIPQWSMWYVLELEEYFDRSKDSELISAAKEKIYKLLEFFGKYENEYGLLENLESWSFIEWSKTRDFMEGVNYPTNMLYARMLRAASSLYFDKSLADKAEKIEQTIREQSYFDGFFHDHAMRGEDGRLVVIKEDITETCQYYAFFMQTASKNLYPELWETLLNDFGPDRENKKLWENIYPSNAFTGYCLRLELLLREGERDKLLSSIKGFYGYMAEETGTLWEHKGKTASCNHGFASQVLVWISQMIV